MLHFPIAFIEINLALGRVLLMPLNFSTLVTNHLSYVVLKFALQYGYNHQNYILYRGVSRIFITGFPTSGVGRYFHRGGEATSDTQLNPGNLISVCPA